MVYTAEPLPLVAGPLVAFYWPWPRWCLALPGACIWKMKAKHHKKLPGRLYRDWGTGAGPGQWQWIPTNTGAGRESYRSILGPTEIWTLIKLLDDFQPFNLPRVWLYIVSVSECTWLWCSSWSLCRHDSPLSSGIKMESNGIINTTHSEIISSDCFSCYHQLGASEMWISG